MITHRLSLLTDDINMISTMAVVLREWLCGRCSRRQVLWLYAYGQFKEGRVVVKLDACCYCVCLVFVVGNGLLLFVTQKAGC